MSTNNPIADHYSQDSLPAVIEAALTEQGTSTDSLTETDLAAVGEFHIGGRPATTHLLDKLDFESGSHIIDIGCGIGGTARVLAGRVASVSGVDLTESYVETGRELNRWVGLADRIDLRTASALDLPFDSGSFDGATMLHVGMNIEDKVGLLTEVARVLKPGAVFGIYDIMSVSEGQPSFPVPWAGDESMSHLTPPEVYRQAAAEAGLQIRSEEDRSEFAGRFFDRLRAGPAPGPLGLQLLMGPAAGVKIANMIAGVQTGLLAPIELIVAKP